MISVASAGNSSEWIDDPNTVRPAGGVYYPFFPGALNSVVSVSALDPDPQQPHGPDGLANISNYGEVAMDGSYPGHQGGWTSFAAPRLSVWEAIHLALGGSSVCQNIFPPLGYVTEAGSDYLNKVLNDAVNAFCPSFPGPTPTP